MVKDKLSSFRSKNTKLKGEVDWLRNASTQNFESTKQWALHSKHQDYCISNLFYDFLVPMVTTHQPKLITEARDLITSEYKLKLLNRTSDKPTETCRDLL